MFGISSRSTGGLWKGTSLEIRDCQRKLTRNTHRGIDVFKFVTNESPVPAVMGSMLSLMAGYLHQTEDYMRNLIELKNSGTDQTHATALASKISATD